eukprot:1158650-Pelagomonas_calceolata.AAC.2
MEIVMRVEYPWPTQLGMASLETNPGPVVKFFLYCTRDMQCGIQGPRACQISASETSLEACATVLLITGNNFATKYPRQINSDAPFAASDTLQCLQLTQAVASLPCLPVNVNWTSKLLPAAGVHCRSREPLHLLHKELQFLKRVSSKGTWRLWARAPWDTMLALRLSSSNLV